MESRYVIGIDLGTTNCSLAYADSSGAPDAFSLPPVTLMAIPQLVNPGEVRDESLLPSSLYLPGALDFPEGSLALPWDAQQPAEFRFFGSATRKNDLIGALIEDVSQDLEELSPMEVNLPATEGVGQIVPVSLETVVTETGILQLWCVARDGRRWKLEFNVRERVNA